MSALLTLALAMPVAGAETPTVFIVEETTIEWEALSSETFDPNWLLPAAPPAGETHLLAEMEDLCALELELTGADDRPIATLGDLFVALRGLTVTERIAQWKRYQAQDPQLFEKWGERLFELCFDDQLYSADWDPESSNPRDGILGANSWELGDDAGKPWTELDSTVELHQAALWIDADLGAIKRVENDFASYPEHKGAEYEAIYPLDGTAWRGRCETRGEFSGVRLYFRCDLPFPFSDYECDLHMLNRRDAKGRLVTDIYSTSSDFNYMAGRDVYLPLTTSAGEPAGHILVRVYGFDLDGVPDRVKHRLRALRASVGNLKLRAEQLEARAEESATGIPPYLIRGAR